MVSNNIQYLWQPTQCMAQLDVEYKVSRLPKKRINDLWHGVGHGIVDGIGK